MNAQQEQQFEQDYDAFIAKGFSYLAKDDAGRWTLAEALQRLRDGTRTVIDQLNGGRSSVSSFEIVTRTLMEKGGIVPIRRAADEPEETAPELTVEQYRSIPVRQIQLRYRNDPTFKQQVESLISRGLI